MQQRWYQSEGSTFIAYVCFFVNEVIDTIRLDALKDRLHLLVEKNVSVVS